MPRASKSAARHLGSATLVVDNGAHSIKAGFVVDGQAAGPGTCEIIPNCIARGPDGPRSHKVYVADQLEQCKDFAEMSFRRPVEKGFIVSWDAELDIWKQAFFQPRSKLHCDPHDANLVLTEAPNCPSALQHNTDQILFEEFEFSSVYRTIGPSLNAYNDMTNIFHDPLNGSSDAAECLMVIDAGHSHTTVTPVFRGRALQGAIRRLDVGGKLLTNRLKELISLRHFNLMDETHLVEQIREDVSFVSQNFVKDIERVRSEKLAPRHHERDRTRDPIVIDYVLPDYHNTFRGHVRPASTKDKSAQADGEQSPNTGTRPVEDTVTLGNERFVTSELLFSPSDIGIAQAGLAEIIVESLGCLPPGLWPAMLANVLVVGGNAQLPGLSERLESELQCLVPAECQVRVRRPKSPMTSTWAGGVRMASDADKLKRSVVTREEYQEHGAAWTARQFQER